jgi:hypothetical protein
MKEKNKSQSHSFSFDLLIERNLKAFKERKGTGWENSILYCKGASFSLK